MGGASGATHFVGYVLPAASGDEDEPNDFEDDAVADAGSASLGSDGLFGWQVVADEGACTESCVRSLAWV
jgi:hypothetical protein